VVQVHSPRLLHPLRSTSLRNYPCFELRDVLCVSVIPGASQLKRNRSENHYQTKAVFSSRLFPRIESKWRTADGNIQAWKTRTKVR
jgi:hypothetical protein